MEENICWVYACPPSQLRPVLWSNSRRDIEMMTRLKVGERQAAIVQDYQTLCYVVSQALGGTPAGGGGGDDPPLQDGVMRPRNAGELAAAMKQVFGLGETGGLRRG